MRLRLLRNGKHWEVVALGSDRDDPLSQNLPQCSVIDFIRQSGSDIERGKAKFWKYIERIVDDARQPHLVLGQDKVHKAGEFQHQNSTIILWEFICDRTRFVFFYHDKNLIVCVTAFLKKSQKTPASVQLEAELAIKRFLEDQKK